MRVYIAGPMTGYPEYNFPSFRDAAQALAGFGHEPLNPARRPPVDGKTWADYLRPDLADLLTAEGVAVLPGWECSRGAVLEVHVAHALDLIVKPLDQWEDQ